MNGITLNVKVQARNCGDQKSFLEWLNKKYPDIDQIIDVAGGSLTLVFTT